MRLEHDAIFRELEPPPGGAARMRSKLVAPRARLSLTIGLAGAAAVAALAALVIVGVDFREADRPVAPADELYAATAFDRLLGRPSAPVPIRVSVGATEVAVSEFTTTTPGVRLFSLESTGTAAVPEDAEAP